MISSPVSFALTVNSVTAQEPQLRAAVILGILRFTTWPSKKFDKKILNVCTIGRPLSESALLPISTLREVKNKTLVVRIINKKEINNIDSCHAVIYGADSDTDTFLISLKRTATSPILTICDGCNLPDAATDIRLMLKGKRIGFGVNLENSNKQGIKFSSSMLELASEVHQ